MAGDLGRDGADVALRGRRTWRVGPIGQRARASGCAGERAEAGSGRWAVRGGRMLGRARGSGPREKRPRGKGKRGRGPDAGEALGRLGCWVGLPAGLGLPRGNREWAGAGGKGRGPSWAEARVGLDTGFGFPSFLFLSSFSNKLKPFEFKFEFEFNPSTQTNKTMHQHECNKHV